MIAICTLCKNVNPYINEWVAWHLSIGFDHIFLSDNNDSDTPYVGDFINSEYMDRVTITHFETIDDKTVCERQAQNINEFMQKHHETVEWCAFIDSDEFIHINKPSVHDWLDNAPSDVECVALNWRMYGDDDIIVGDESVPVQERIVKCLDSKFRDNETYYYCMCKKIIRLKSDIEAYDMFLFYRDGEYIDMYDYTFKPQGKCAVLLTDENILDFECFINHYITKTLSECIKYKCSDLWGINTLEDYFFRFNERTKEKEKYLVEHYKP